MKQPADSKTYRTITEYAVLLAVVGLGLLALDALTHGALYHLGLVALAKSADLGR